MFNAGLVSAVTRSGSVGGAPLGLLRGLRWTGPYEQGDRAEEFATKELALTLGGPIVSDRAAFFLDLGLERDAFGQTAPTTGLTLRVAAIRPLASATRAGYGSKRFCTTSSVSSRAPSMLHRTVPCRNLFAKITFSLR